MSAVVTALLLVPAGAASAATNFTSSQITTPTDPTWALWNQNVPNTIHVEGTTAGGDSNADLVCFFGSKRRVLATNVTVTANAFSGDFPLVALATTIPFPPQFPYCVLRAIPAGDPTNYPPDAASAFAGPHVGTGIKGAFKVGGSGINKDVVVDYYIGSGQAEGQMEYDSLASCGLDYSFVFDPTTLASSDPLYYCAGWVYIRNGCVTPDVGPLCVETTRSELQVDGVNTYLPYGSKNLYTVDATHASSLLTGYPLLSFSTFVDPLNGDVHMSETNQTARCSPNAAAYYPTQTNPAWPTDCSSFAPGGVKVDRTGLGNDKGRRATFTDVWSSTDGASHQVDVEYDVEVTGDSGTVPGVSFDYSWDASGFLGPAAGDTIAGPSSDVPSSVLIDGNGASPDLFQFPQGAVTFSNAPANVHWWRAGGETAYGTFRLVFTVTPNNPVTIAQSYLQGSTKTEISDQIPDEQARIGRPRISMSPDDGATVDHPDVTVTGTATDPRGGITSLTVNGDAVAVAGDGTWSKAMTLAQGENTITAVATDTSGNTTTRVAKVTFTPPAPPGGGTTPPPGGGAVADKIAPTLGLVIARIKLAALSARGLPVKLTCSEACTYVVTLFVDTKTAKRVGLAAKNVQVGRATGRLTTKGAKTVRVKLTRKARRKLAKLKKVRLTVSVNAKDAAGNNALKAKKVVIKR